VLRVSLVVAEIGGHRARDVPVWGSVSVAAGSGLIHRVGSAGAVQCSVAAVYRNSVLAQSWCLLRQLTRKPRDCTVSRGAGASDTDARSGDMTRRRAAALRQVVFFWQRSLVTDNPHL